MLALALYRRDLCTGCGYPKILHHPRHHFDVEVDLCVIRGALDRFDRILGDQDDKVRKAQEGNPSAPQPKDGRMVSVRMKPPSQGAPQARPLRR